MPVLDLPDLHLAEAGVYVWGVMLFPTSPENHGPFVEAMRNEATLRSVERNRPEALKHDMAQEVAKAALAQRRGLGLDAYARKANPITAAGILRGDMAARLFVFVLACAEHEPQNANMEYAYRTFGMLHQNKVQGLSRATLTKHWKEFAPAAHLWAAFSIKKQWFDEASSSGLARFLGFAESLRMMGERIKPSHAQETLLPQDLAWRASDRFILPDFGQIPLPTPATLISLARNSLQ